MPAVSELPKVAAYEGRGVITRAMSDRNGGGIRHYEVRADGGTVAGEVHCSTYDSVYFRSNYQAVKDKVKRDAIVDGICMMSVVRKCLV